MPLERPVAATDRGCSARVKPIVSSGTYVTMSRCFRRWSSSRDSRRRCCPCRRSFVSSALAASMPASGNRNPRSRWSAPLCCLIRRLRLSLRLHQCSAVRHSDPNPSVPIARRCRRVRRCRYCYWHWHSLVVDCSCWIFPHPIHRLPMMTSVVAVVSISKPVPSSQRHSRCPIRRS